MSLEVVPGTALPIVPSDAALLTASGLAVGYQHQALLPPVSLEIRPGELWAMVGPNGAGKSTLMTTLLGLIAPVAGQVEHAAGARLAYVPQQSSIDPIFPMRVIDVVLSGRQRPGRLIGRYRGDDVLAAERAMEEAGLQSLRHLQVRDLSGGQRQRVMIARAVASEANLVLLDEPTAALDAAAEREVLQLIASLPRRPRVAAVMITHLVQEALALADHVLLVDRDHGVCVAGTPAEINAHPGFTSLYRPRFGAPEGAR